MLFAFFFFLLNLGFRFRGVQKEVTKRMPYPLFHLPNRKMQKLLSSKTRRKYSPMSMQPSRRLLPVPSPRSTRKKSLRNPTWTTRTKLSAHGWYPSGCFQMSHYPSPSRISMAWQAQMLALTKRNCTRNKIPTLVLSCIQRLDCRLFDSLG